MSRPNLWHDEWVNHATSVQPVSDETIVRIRFRTGTESKYEYAAKQINWRQRNQAHDVVAYRVEREAGE